MKEQSLSYSSIIMILSRITPLPALSTTTRNVLRTLIHHTIPLILPTFNSTASLYHLGNRMISSRSRTGSSSSKRSTAVLESAIPLSSLGKHLSHLASPETLVSTQSRMTFLMPSLVWLSPRFSPVSSFSSRSSASTVSGAKRMTIESAIPFVKTQLH